MCECVVLLGVICIFKASWQLQGARDVLLLLLLLCQLSPADMCKPVAASQGLRAVSSCNCASHH
jgi:hypothetical protein